MLAYKSKIVKKIQPQTVLCKKDELSFMQSHLRNMKSCGDIIGTIMVNCIPAK